MDVCEGDANGDIVDACAEDVSVSLLDVIDVAEAAAAAAAARRFFFSAPETMRERECAMRVER